MKQITTNNSDRVTSPTQLLDAPLAHNRYHRYVVMAFFLLAMSLLVGLSCLVMQGQVKPSLNIHYDMEKRHLVYATDKPQYLKHDQNTIKVVQISVDGQRYDVHDYWLRTDLQGTQDKQSFEHFYRGERILRDAIDKPTSILLETGQWLWLSFSPRQIKDYDTVFWLSRVSAAVMMFFSLWIFAIAPAQRGAYAAVFGSYSFGIGFLIADTSLSRMWAIDADLFYILVKLSECMTVIYTASIFYLVWHLPKPLITRAVVKLVPWLVFFVMFFLFLLSLFGIVHNLVFTFELPYFITHLLVIGILIYKFFYHFIQRKSDLLGWIAMRWVMLATIVGISIPLTYHFLVYFSILDALPAFALDSIVLFKIGLSALVASSILYQAESVWWRLWMVLVAFFGFITVLLIAYYVVGVNGLPVLCIALLVAMLCAVMTKQYLYKKYGLSNAQHYNAMLNALFTMNEPNERYLSDTEKWRRVLQKTLSPNQLTQLATPTQVLPPNKTPAVWLEQGGTRMHVAGVTPDVTWVMTGASQGLRLFNQKDVQLVNSLWHIFKQNQETHTAFLQGERDERRRIAADLHDDIGGKLLYLSSGEGEYGKYAQETLQDLRSLARGLSSDSKTLDEVMADLNYHIAESCELVDADCRSQIALGEWETHIVAPREATTLTSIVQELVRNALKHTQVSHLHFECVCDNTMEIKVTNNGDITTQARWSVGMGIPSIKRRITDLKGTVVWQALPSGGVSCLISIPKYPFLNTHAK